MPDSALSPDVPSVYCYLVVLLVGVVIARGAVNKLLDSSYGRWSFGQTWLLFYTQSLIPVVLFWFLDYTSVIHDTSLFAALAVAAGYQQIFAGGIKDITLPGQTSKLWQPFEAWRNNVINSIAIRARQRLDKFDLRVATYCADDPARLATLSKTVAQYASDPVDLAARTAAADVSTPERKLSLAKMLIRELRSVDLAGYGGILNRAALVPASWYLFRITPGRRASWGALLGTTVLIFIFFLLLGSAPLNSVSPLLGPYQRWRLTKANASARDRFRTNEYFLEVLSHPDPDLDPKVVISGSKVLSADSDPSKDIDPNKVISSSIEELRYRGISPDVVKEFINLASHSKPLWVRNYWLPQFAAGLQNPNLETRARLHAAMVVLVDDAGLSADLPQAIREWKTSSDAQQGDMDVLARAWDKWLPKVAEPVTSPPNTSRSPQAGSQ